MIREFEEGIIIKGAFTLEQVISLFKGKKCYYINENDIMDHCYKTLVSIAIWKDCLIIYPLKNTNMKGVEVIRKIIEEREILKE